MEKVLFIVIMFMYHGNCHITGRIHIAEGEPYILSCGINYQKQFSSCFVNNPGGKIIKYPDRPEWDKERMKFLHNSTTCGLEIRNAKKEVYGIWTCMMTLHSSKGEFTEKTKIRVIWK